MVNIDSCISSNKDEECKEQLEKINECIQNAGRDRDVEELGNCTAELEGVKYSLSPGIRVSEIFAQVEKYPKNKYDMNLEIMEVDDYKERQIDRFRVRDILGDFTPKEAYEHGLNEDVLEGMMESIRNGKTLPTPFLSWNREGEVEPFQEGRHRGEAMKKMGKEHILTWTAKRCKYSEERSESRGCGDSNYVKNIAQ